ncbi:cobalt transporter [Devosia riboflavina]|uniref:Cobalt transporter n=1 Tax=Devosia riboflavina TaxID=46914 RepID=A0A087LYR9_9HYPH|nr:cation diffusion facilitator family transporter [Devosia riboflavina]KFL29772.1 cobalt transporter [Devosia riboflavina]
MLRSVLSWFGFGPAHPSSAHGHSHGEGEPGHTHGLIDASIPTTSQGISAIKWSFVILAVTAVLQLVVVYYSSSVALLADTIHNLGDATTAIPLWIAFVLARRKPSKTFTYGLGRVEDLAGIVIVLIILASAIVAGYAAIDRLLNPQPVTQLGWLVAAGIVGFIGNEAVAVLRIRVGRRINSAALIADGYHARTDGLTSLAVVGGAIGVWLGFPLADPVIGLLITAAIFGIVWQSARAVLTRMLDGVEPATTAEVHHAAAHVDGIDKVTRVRGRWIGHRLHLNIELALHDGLLLGAANSIADELRQELAEHIPGLEETIVSFVSPNQGPDHPHHNAPKPFRVDGKLAGGLLEIVDTAVGERMRLRLSRHATNLSAEVAIERANGAKEVLALRPAALDHHIMESTAAPAEPHEFNARLLLASGSEVEELSFVMVEPAGHIH